MDQVPEDQQDFKIKSPLENLYGKSNLEREPLFSTTSGTPAGSAPGPEVDDREDIGEGELVTASDTELPPDQENIQTEDQSYRETVRGVRSYMGWDFIPDLESSATSSSDNPWAGGRPQPVGRVSVAFPAEEWLCKKFEDLNCTTQLGTCRPLPQETIRKWEKASREISYICNQVAGFNHCVTKLQMKCRKTSGYPSEGAVQRQRFTGGQEGSG